GIAHDFNNILTIVMNGAAVARRSMPPSSAGVRALDDVIDASERASALTRQLLTFSRRSTTKATVVDIRSLVENATSMLERLVGEQVRLETDLSEVPSACADPAQIDQVLVNLIINARDAMPDGGVIRVATRCDRVEVSGPKPWAGALPGEYAVVAVRDNGAGMSAEVIERVFEPFFTTKEVGKGTGLGLAITRTIMEKHHGRVAVHTKPEEGTCFELHLPFRQPPTDAKAAAGDSLLEESGDKAGDNSGINPGTSIAAD
ncbi:MAG: hybrid sensor histidine kinase/response regulator, partial [Myxococcales bacterium]|nr:hybrid sensor histidine kinase/response regulator [Myxococcales bacterium]